MPEEQDGSQQTEHNPAAPLGGGSQQGALSPELVKQVADRVYAMLMQDVAIERERQRPSSRVLGGRGDW